MIYNQLNVIKSQIQRNKINTIDRMFRERKKIPYNGIRMLRTELEESNWR